MDSSIASTTLYDDWQTRRDRLSSSTEAGRLRAAPQLKVLDYLLRRYRGTNEGKRPARFCLRSNFSWNDRRIVVHQHLSRGKVAGVKNQAEADNRVASILHRMASDDREEDDTRVVDEPMETIIYSPDMIRAWKPIRKLLKRHLDADYEILAALTQYHFLPRTAMQHLSARLSDISYNDWYAMHLLSQCQNMNTVDYAVRAWRERVAHNQFDDITEELEKYFRRADRRKMAAEKMREELADPNPSVRLAATSLLEELGELDDVGLLSDLLSLPESDKEDERERDALIHAMKRIAEGSIS